MSKQEKPAFTPHRIEWTPEKVENFWSYFSANAPTDDQYFSARYGKQIIDYVELHLELRGRVIDYGCGPGFLIRELLERGISCEGLDFSKESVKEVNSQFGDHALFRGAQEINTFPSSVPDGSVDIVFAVEVLEHLLDDQLEPTLRELYRLLKPGGHIVITAPNNEDLGLHTVVCPDCGAMFHRWQHVRSFSAQSLKALMNKPGFDVTKCDQTAFVPNVRKSAARRLLELLRLIEPKRPGLPCLVYIGEKHANDSRVVK